RKPRHRATRRERSRKRMPASGARDSTSEPTEATLASIERAYEPRARRRTASPGARDTGANDDVRTQGTHGGDREGASGDRARGGGDGDAGERRRARVGRARRRDGGDDRRAPRTRARTNAAHR
ncbi:hypothetical protein BE221DRAFT_83672, partial [Ostreococcus tauri]